MCRRVHFRPATRSSGPPRSRRHFGQRCYSSVQSDVLSNDQVIVEQRDVGVLHLDQRIIASRVGKHVDAGAAGEGVIAISSVKMIVENRADQRVVTDAARQYQGNLVNEDATGVDDVSPRGSLDNELVFGRFMISLEAARVP